MKSDDADVSRTSRRLLVTACLFAVVGGYLDAYSYVAHGRVFANGQTGNVVFLAVYASAGEWAQAARHLPPIAAFVLGVAVAKALDARMRQPFRATLICQAFEAAILCALTVCADRLPDGCVVPIISFVAALQNTSFSTIGPWSFNSAMTTGNLRNAASGLVLWLAGHEPARNRGKAIALGFVCLAFLTGALGGGLCTRWNARHALLPCVVLVIAGGLLTRRESSEDR